MHCKSLWIKVSAKCINVNNYFFCFAFVSNRLPGGICQNSKANVTVLQMTLGWLLQFISCLTADQVQQHWFQKPHALEWSYARLAAVRKQLNWPAVYFSPGSVPENNAASIQSCICCSEALHYTKTKAISFRFIRINYRRQFKWHSMHHNNTENCKYCNNLNSKILFKSLKMVRLFNVFKRTRMLIKAENTIKYWIQ